MENPIKVIATLSNGLAIYLRNSKDVEFSESIVASGKPVPVVSPTGAQQYKFNHPASGWFCSINADDAERMSCVKQLPNGDIVVEVSPLVTYTKKDLAKAKPFIS